MKSKMNQIPDIHIVSRLNLSQLHVTLLVMREIEGGKKRENIMKNQTTAQIYLWDQAMLQA